MSAPTSIVATSDSVGLTYVNGRELTIFGSETVQNSIRQFAKYGKITFSKEQYFKSTRYCFCFFKPVVKLQELYNLGDEVLILCCSNALENFKSRTKDFLDYLLGTNAEYKNRLDKVTCFLLDDNENIQEIISEDRKNYPDTRLIVPFSYNELKSGLSEEMLLNKLRTFLYERDLFGMASPLISDNLFFGRDRTNYISELYGKYRQGEQGGVFGLRRIGKTSILNQLKQRVIQDNGVAVYFDMSMLHHQRWNSLLHHVVEMVQQEYKNSEYGEGAQLPPCFELPSSSSRYNEARAPISFEEDIRDLYFAFGEKRILLIFDEIEQIGFATSATDHWRNGNDALFFWQAIRAVFQKNQQMFCFVIAGVNPKCIEIAKINESDNPIFNMLNPLYVNLFDLFDVKDMVSNIGGHIGLQFDEEIFTKLVDDYGGHPFLTRKVCSIINAEVLKNGEARPYKVSKYEYDRQKESFQSGLEDVIKQILGVLVDYYPEEYEILKTLAVNGSDEFRRKLVYGDSSVPHLMGYCLIKKDKNDYFFRIKSVETYLKNIYKYERNLNSLSDKWAQISVRRNAIEIELRNLIYAQLKTKYGRKAKEKLVEIVETIAKQDKKQISRVGNAATLEKAMEELYFIQLKTIIKKDWKTYEAIFTDLSKFEFYMDRINECRADAHAKDLDEEDMSMIRFAFKFFEENLEIT